MRKIVVSEFLTVDNVMEDPGGAEPFKYGGWSFESSDDQSGKYKLEEMSEIGALLLGRVAYEGFAKVWPTLKDDMGYADKMNSMPKYVVSTTLKKAEWNNSTIISKDVVKEIAKLKEEPGDDIFVFGSAELTNTLLQHDLVDEFRLMIHPVILGTGKRLFFKDKKVPLKLLDTKVFSKGIILLTYAVEKK